KGTQIYGHSQSILQEGAEEAELWGNPLQAGKQEASDPPRQRGSGPSAPSCSNQAVPRSRCPMVQRTPPIPAIGSVPASPGSGSVAPKRQTMRTVRHFKPI